jgi:chromatin remodeling complex protein RSC6
VEAAGLNEDEMALIIKRFKIALKGRKEYSNKNKTRGKRSCFKCGKTGHFIAKCLDNDSDQGQEKSGKKEKNKNYRKAKARRTLERNGTRTAPLPTPTTKDLLPLPSTNPHSSPTNTIHVLWLSRKRYVFGTHPSTLHLVMKNHPMMK